MDFINNISDKIYPMGSAAVLAGAMLISIFFGLSEKKVVKKVIAIISAGSLAAAFYFNIYGFLAKGDFSNFLMDYNLLHVILISASLFCALNLLLFISMHRIDSNNFIKLIIILLFASISLIFLIISSNFIMIFTSFVIFGLAVFQLFTGLNPEIKKMGDHPLRFFLTVSLSLSLLFFGFSIFFSGTNILNIKQFLEPGEIAGPLIAFSALVFAAAVYLYFFIFPLQGTYLKLVKRIDYTSLSVIWFFYFPAGIIMLFKLNSLFYFFLDKNNYFISLAIFILAFFGMAAANIGAIRTNSMRRVLAFLFLFFIMLFMLSDAIFSSGLAGRLEVEWLNLFTLLMIIIGFLPVYSTAVILEKEKGGDSIKNLRGLLKGNIYIAVNLIIIFLSWLLFTCFIIPFILNASSGNIFGTGVLKLPVFLIIAALIIFLAVNIIRIIIELFRAPGELKAGIQVKFPKYFYIYLTFFTVVLLGMLVIGFLELFKADIGIINFELSEFNIFNLNNN